MLTHEQNELLTRVGPVANYLTTVFPAALMVGLGLSTAVAPLTAAALGAVAGEHAGIASGINNAVSRVAGLLAVAVLGIVVLAAFNSRLDARLEGLAIPPEARQRIDAERTKLAGATAPRELPDVTRNQVDRAVDEAFVGGFRLAMFIAAGLALAGAASALLMIDGRPTPKGTPAES